MRRMSFLETSDALGDARERRGESLDQVAEVTGIRRKYLEELESGSGWFDPYPGRVYGRFFLREYAEYLGLDPAPLLDAFDGEAEAGPTQAPTEGRTLRPRRSSPSNALVAIAALVCLLALLGSSAILRGADRDSPAFGPADVVPHVRRHDGGAHAPAERGPVQRIRAVATVSDRSWIEALSDGEAIYRATAPEGSVLTFRADRRLELILGNAGGVALVVNGQPEPTGSAGQVIHLRFDLRGSRVTAAEI
jgi:cytoskeleton protein RodZ